MLRPLGDKGGEWHIGGRCSAFARLLLQVDIDKGVNLSEVVSEALAEPVTRGTVCWRNRQVSKIRGPIWAPLHGWAISPRGEDFILRRIHYR